VQLVGLGAAAGVCLATNAPWWLLVLPGLAWLVNVAAGLRFVRRPVTRHAGLRPFAEGFVVAVIVSSLLVFGRWLI
jgi:hypothetical protein